MDDSQSYLSGDDSGDEGKRGVKGKGKDEKDRKSGGINRVSRACNGCRKMKMRCIGAEDPPCKRCRNTGMECIMEKPAGKNGNGEGGDDRIRSLENQVSSLQSTLTELVSTLRSSIGATNNAAQPLGPQIQAPFNRVSPHSHPHSSDFNNTFAQSAGISNMSMLSTSPHGSLGELGYHSGSAGAGPTPPLFGSGAAAGPGPSSSMMQQPSLSPNNHMQGQGHVRFAPSDQIQWVSPQNSTGTGSQPSPFGLNMDQMQAQAQGTGMLGSGGLPDSSWTQSQSDLRSENVPGRSQGHDPSHPIEFSSIPPTRSGSATPDDLLAPEDIINPLGAMSNMAGLVEAAVKLSKKEKDKSSVKSVGGEAGVGGKRASRLDDDDDDVIPGRTPKRRQSPILPHGPVIQELQHLPPQSSKEKGKKEKKKTHIHAYPDIVAEGMIPEEEGKELMAIFYAGSSNFIPCFDPAVDTWESLRIRSPFSITAIVMAGARVRDGGGPISDVQRLAREHAQRIAVGTLFNPVARIEAVQAMILLAAFSENGWLPGGHAVRMAIDMGLNRSFLHLLRTGVGKGKTLQQLEEERYLVVQSRIWFCLYLIEHQMAYGMGRPAILREDETIHQCRRLLEHPMSITSDARLVSTVELMALRAPLHIELTASPDLPITENTMRRLRQANADFDAWERYWDRVLGDRFGKGRGDFFRESLIIQRQYAELFVNSQLLRGIKEPTDVVNMPEEKRALAIRAMRNAQRCIEICLRGENYRNGLRYAVHYTHVCAAFAASFLIRIARLFPHELNLKKTAKDVDELANVLSEVPAGRYARSLRLILRRARKAKVIPAQSRPGSPLRTGAQLPGLSPISDLKPHSFGPAQSPFSPTQMINPAYLSTPTPGGSGMTPRQGQGFASHTQGQAQVQSQQQIQQHQNQSQGQMPEMAFTPGTTALIQQAAQQIVDDSPSSAADLFEFDQLFAVETMERAGMTQVGDQLPLFLDGHSLGGGQGTDLAPFVGMEQFFLPPALDNRLGGPSAAEQNGSAIGNFDPNLLAEEIWW